MLVVLPYHSKDATLALSNLQWAVHLDGKVPFDCLLVFPEGQENAAITETAERYFKSVQKLTLFIPFDTWPAHKNSMFQQTANWIYHHAKDRFLWWEPDAVLTKRDAFQQIHEAAKEKPFFGCWLQSGWMDLVGLWPHNTIQLCERAMLSRAAPFDQVAGREIGTMVQHSPLFQCVWDLNGLPLDFKTKDDLKVINKDAVLLHRVKNDSLRKMLGAKCVGAAVAKTVERGQTCIVMLGRYGDCINVLPIAQHIYQTTGTKPAFMIAKDYADLLEGVTYVDPIIWKHSFTDVSGAVEKVSEDFSQVLVAQVNSRNVGVNTQCSSFTEESWRQAGYLGEYTKLPLTFDNRSEKREAALLESVRKTEKPLLLVNLEGKSSPYEHKRELWEQLNRHWAVHYEIVDLGRVKAARLFDLLGLMDEAALLITIDTSTLHLATASTVPVIALITQTPTQWHGSRPRCNCVLAIHYQKSPERFPEINHVIETTLRNIKERAESQTEVKPFQQQTQWRSGVVNLPLDRNISHFNPGLCRDGRGRLWLIARKSSRGVNDKFNSKLLFCELSEEMTVKATKELPLKHLKLDQHEDPRIIFKNGRFYISFCAWSRKPLVMPKQVICAYNGDVVEMVKVVEYGKNTNYVHGVEKNWLFFGAQDRFHFVYQFSPHIVVMMAEDASFTQYVTETKVDWPYGEIRGGTPPVQIGEEFLSFFHSSLFMQKGKRRYYMGAYTFETKPPFAVKRITRKPLLIGSELDTCIHGGPPCVFPCGSVFDGKEWTVSFGVNDEACGWIKIPQEDLEKLLCN